MARLTQQHHVAATLKRAPDMHGPCLEFVMLSPDQMEGIVGAGVARSEL